MKGKRCENTGRPGSIRESSAFNQVFDLFMTAVLQNTYRLSRLGESDDDLDPIYEDRENTALDALIAVIDAYAAALVVEQVQAVLKPDRKTEPQTAVESTPAQAATLPPAVLAAVAQVYAQNENALLRFGGNHPHPLIAILRDGTRQEFPREPSPAQS